uniref:Uncharacterized protein n=1 Tax=Anopheles melas TaxID=34690 RepID=A0A182TFR8_9DIPT
MPAYAGFDSFGTSRRTAESLYYTAKEYDSAEESDYVRRAIFEDGPNTIFNRRYVDPWDMENYVYIRKQVMDPTSESEVPPSPAGEPIQSKFYYVPGELNGSGLECRDCSSAELIDPEFDPVARGEDLEGQSVVLLPEEEEALEGESQHHRQQHPMVDDERPSELEDELNAEDDEDEDGFYTERYDTVMDEDSIGGDEHVYSSYTGRFQLPEGVRGVYAIASSIRTVNRTGYTVFQTGPARTGYGDYFLHVAASPLREGKWWSFQQRSGLRGYRRLMQRCKEVPTISSGRVF